VEAFQPITAEVLLQSDRGMKEFDFLRARPTYDLLLKHQTLRQFLEKTFLGHMADFGIVPSSDFYRRNADFALYLSMIPLALSAMSLIWTSRIDPQCAWAIAHKIAVGLTGLSSADFLLRLEPKRGLGLAATYHYLRETLFKNVAL